MDAWYKLSLLFATRQIEHRLYRDFVAGERFYINILILPV